MTDASKGVLNLNDTAKDVLVELARNLEANPDISTYALTIQDEDGATYDLLIGLDYESGEVIEFPKEFIH